MNATRRLQSLITLGTVGLLLGSSLMGTPLAAHAQSRLRLNLPDLRAPGNRESGSTRSNNVCLADPNEQVVALMPDTNYGLTTEAYPEFYFYLPETNVRLVKFVIYNETSGELFYEGQFNIKGDAGIVSLELPNNGIQRSLEVDESYYWYFSIVCDAYNPDANVVVGGTVERVATPLAVSQAVSTASPQALPGIYAEAGLWQDALSASAQLKASGTDSLAWTSLLEAVDLGEFSNFPMLYNGLAPEGLAATSTAQ